MQDCSVSERAKLLRFFRQFAIDDLLKGIRRLVADEQPAVDEKRRGAGNAEALALFDIGGDGRLMFAALEAAVESGAVELQIARVLFELRLLQSRGTLEKKIVIFPKFPLLGGAARGLMRLRCQRVQAGYREIAENPPDFAVVLFHELMQRRRDRFAERALEVEKLDDGDGRLFPAAGKALGRVDADRRGIIEKNLD